MLAQLELVGIAVDDVGGQPNPRVLLDGDLGHHVGRRQAGKAEPVVDGEGRQHRRARRPRARPCCGCGSTGRPAAADGSATSQSRHSWMRSTPSAPEVQKNSFSNVELWQGSRHRTNPQIASLSSVFGVEAPVSSSRSRMRGGRHPGGRARPCSMMACTGQSISARMDVVVVLFGNVAVADKRRVSPVVEREVLRCVLGADAEAVAHASDRAGFASWLSRSPPPPRKAAVRVKAPCRQSRHSIIEMSGDHLRGTAASRLAATLVAPSSVAHAPRPRSTTDHRSSRARSSAVARTVAQRTRDGGHRRRAVEARPALPGVLPVEVGQHRRGDGDRAVVGEDATRRRSRVRCRAGEASRGRAWCRGPARLSRPAK